MATFTMLVSGSTVDEWQIGPGGTSLTEAVRVSGDGKYVYAVDPPDDGAWRIQLWNSNSTRPGDLDAGATITSVQIEAIASNYSVAADSGNYEVMARIGGTSAYTAVGGSVNLTVAKDLPRPGGGSWVYTDFDTSLYFGMRHRANATSGTYFAAHFDYVKVVVTYTPTPATPPVAAFGVSTTTGSAPLTCTFTDSSTNAPTSWAWAFGDTATSSAQNPSHVYTTVGTYTVTLTASNGGGSDAEVKNSLVNVQTPTVAVAAAFTAAPTTGVQNLGVQFYDGSTGTPTPTSWAWAFGDTETSTAQNPFHTYTTAGTYTVIHTATNTTPSTSTVTKTDYVVVGSGLPTPTITVNTTNGPKPLTVVFTGTASNADSASWSWNFGGDGASIVQNPTHVFASVGTYTVVLTASNAIGTASSSKVITVTYSPASAAFTAEPLFGYAPHTVRFRDLSTGDVGSWIWSFGDTTTSTSQHPVYTYQSTGAKTVSLTVDPVNAAITTSPFLSTLTSTSLICVANPLPSWGLFLYELKHHLMEPLYEQNNVNGFDDFGGIAQVCKLVQQRLQKFVLATAALRKEATLSAATANTEDFTLPTDLIELLRVEVNGVAYYPADHFQKDADGLLNYYILNDTLGITIPGTFGTTPTVKVWYSYVPPVVSIPDVIPGSCPGATYVWAFFPLPYVLWWIIKYGVLADLFNQSGEKNDPLRAAKCEELFNEGTEIYKLLYRGEA
jgi:PKD repeat protein